MTSKELEAKVQRLEDILEIQALQARYQYYLAMYMGKRVGDELFAKNDPDVSLDIGTKWFGLESVKRCFSLLDKVSREEPGRMGALVAIQPLINVAKDGKTATGHWWGGGPCVLPIKEGPDDKEHLEALWMWGRYVMDYVKEGGKWKIKKLGYYQHFLSPVAKGWLNCPRPFQVRPFELTEGGKPDAPGALSDLYSPKKHNQYGPPIPDPVE
jgi:hypothetical protein